MIILIYNINDKKSYPHISCKGTFQLTYIRDTETRTWEEEMSLYPELPEDVQERARAYALQHYEKQMAVMEEQERQQGH